MLGISSAWAGGLICIFGIHTNFNFECDVLSASVALGSGNATSPNSLFKGKYDKILKLHAAPVGYPLNYEEIKSLNRVLCAGVMEDWDGATLVKTRCHQHPAANINLNRAGSPPIIFLPTLYYTVSNRYDHIKRVTEFARDAGVYLFCSMERLFQDKYCRGHFSRI